MPDGLHCESEHLAIYRYFVDGHFVVRRTQCKFNVVGADMGLDQTINRSKQSCGVSLARQEEKTLSLNVN